MRWVSISGCVGPPAKETSWDRFGRAGLRDLSSDVRALAAYVSRTARPPNGGGVAPRD
jgi:hypothetical protein